MLRSQILTRQMCLALGLENFQTVDVDHRTRCYGAIIDHQDDWRIVLVCEFRPFLKVLLTYHRIRFSGDTKPTDNLVKAGQNATVLLHEATMADDQEEMAAQKAHSTVGQAIKIGRESVPLFLMPKRLVNLFFSLQDEREEHYANPLLRSLPQNAAVYLERFRRWSQCGACFRPC